MFARAAIIFLPDGTLSDAEGQFMQHDAYLDILFCRTDKEFYDVFASAVLKQTSSKFDELMGPAKIFLSLLF